MKTTPKVLAAVLSTAALTSSVGSVSAQQPGDKPTPPSVAYWHVWTDKDGVSHQRKEALHDFEFKTIEPPAAPMWIDKLQAEGASITVLVMPVGWLGEWHENPHRQWIVPLSGRWFVETMDGQRLEMGREKSPSARTRAPRPTPKATRDTSREPSATCLS